MQPSKLILFPFLGLIILSALVPPLDAGRAFFIFGDSLVDSGNNNYLVTEARADTFPYGIDYPTHRATGRFSNGLNIPDLISKSIIFFVPNILSIYSSWIFHITAIWEQTPPKIWTEKAHLLHTEKPFRPNWQTLYISGEYIGSEPPLPCLSPEHRGEKLLVGANFASAGVGILNDTGFQFVRCSFIICLHRSF